MSCYIWLGNEPDPAVMIPAWQMFEHIGFSIREIVRLFQYLIDTGVSLSESADTPSESG